MSFNISNNAFKKNNLDASIRNLIRSLMKYQLSQSYRKIFLEKTFDLTHKKFNYYSISYILASLENLVRVHEDIENIVLVKNNDIYELYMLKKSSYSKFLEAKGMTVVSYSNKIFEDNRKIHKRKRKDFNEHDTYDDLSKNIKKHDNGVSHKSNEYIIKNDSEEKNVKSDSIDDKLIQKFKDLSEKEKNDLLNLMTKGTTTNIENNIQDNIEFFVDKKGNTDLKDQKILKSEKIDVSEKINVREKRNIRKVIRYEP